MPVTNSRQSKGLQVPWPPSPLVRDWPVTHSSDICLSSRVTSQHRTLKQYSTTEQSAQRQSKSMLFSTQNASLSMWRSVAKRHPPSYFWQLLASKLPADCPVLGPGHQPGLDSNPPQVKATSWAWNHILLRYITITEENNVDQKLRQ